MSEDDGTLAQTCDFLDSIKPGTLAQRLLPAALASSAKSE
jgi:hypothetical protein